MPVILQTPSSRLMHSMHRMMHNQICHRLISLPVIPQGDRQPLPAFLHYHTIMSCFRSSGPDSSEQVLTQHANICSSRWHASNARTYTSTYKQQVKMKCKLNNKNKHAGILLANKVTQGLDLDMKCKLNKRNKQAGTLLTNKATQALGSGAHGLVDCCTPAKHKLVTCIRSPYEWTSRQIHKSTSFTNR